MNDREAKYLVAYDIADPKRLRRVARRLEKDAIRCQKSVFIFRGTDGRLRSILDQLARIIDPTVDLVQAWRLAPRQSALGQHRGTAPYLFPDVAVLRGDHVRLLGEDGG